MLSPEQTRTALEEIRLKCGGILKPEVVVDEAADPAHPLHDRFDWDDSSAARAYRIDQARTLIRSVRVEVRTEVRRIDAPYYVRDPGADVRESGYVNLPRLQTEKELAAAALVQEFSRALAILERARDLAVALGIDASVEDILRRLQTMSEQVPILSAG